MIHDVSTTLSPIAAERILFAEIVAKLGACLEESRLDLTNDPVAHIKQHVRLCEAVYQNARLWIALQDDLLDFDNRLPLELRVRLIAIGSVAKRSGSNALRDTHGLPLLIAINSAILRGLENVQRNQLAADAVVGMAGDTSIGEPRAAVVDLGSVRRERQSQSAALPLDAACPSNAVNPPPLQSITTRYHTATSPLRRDGTIAASTEREQRQKARYGETDA